uniref:RNA polymerase sigma factor n=1 Tax=Agathobacter sp. TaxID=2021311 RepID=UPI004055FB3C
MKEFEKIYSEYYDTVFQYVLSLCRNEHQAEEITQEAFFKALKSIDTFRGECKLSVWLCQIAKNTFYTVSKRQQRQADYPLEMVQSEGSLEKRLADKEDALRIHRLLHSLDEPYKEVFWMRTFGELSFKEIGVLFGKTESWARVTYHRAKMKIKEGIE